MRNCHSDTSWRHNSLAVSVKMNILLFAPGYLVVLVISIGVLGAVRNILLCATVQVCCLNLATLRCVHLSPMLTCYPDAIMSLLCFGIGVVRIPLPCCVPVELRYSIVRPRSSVSVPVDSQLALPPCCCVLEPDICCVTSAVSSRVLGLDCQEMVL